MTHLDTRPDLSCSSEDMVNLAGQTRISDGKSQGGKLSFDALLRSNPEYKSACDKRIRRAIDSRFRQIQEQTEQLERLMPLLSALAGRYGLTWEQGQDIQPLMDALADDAPAYSREERKRQLMEQAELLRRYSPNFRLEQELASPLFRALTAQGVPLFAAHALAHQNESLAEAMSYAIDRTRQSMADQLRAGLERPSENAMGGRLSPRIVADPKAMTTKERQRLRERVARGEKVYW